MHVGVIASMKKGLEHFVYRELEVLASEGCTISLFPSSHACELHKNPSPRLFVRALKACDQIITVTEVIVHLYEELGVDCVHELRGMFAFAVWDRPRCRLFVARDRLGIKPLHYTHLRDRLVFGSEIKAILQHPEVQATPNLEGLSNFLLLKYVPAPQTMFGGILALPPGHLLTRDEHGVAVRAYWDLSFAGNQDGHQSEESYAEQLEALLRESVRLELRSDVPFGALLGGGVDSSTVVALMSQFLDEPVNTFSVGFQGDGEEFSDLPYARMVARQYQTDHHEVLVGPDHFVDLAEKALWRLDQPIADPAVLANYMPRMKADLGDLAADYLFAQQLARTDATDPLSRMLYVDTKLWLPDDLLARGDKTSMAASVEARVPLLDHKLVEFAAALPPHLKLKRLTRKYPLKKVSRAWLPRRIIYRSKKGFRYPFRCGSRMTPIRLAVAER